MASIIKKCAKIITTNEYGGVWCVVVVVVRRLCTVKNVLIKREITRRQLFEGESLQRIEMEQISGTAALAANDERREDGVVMRGGLAGLGERVWGVAERKRDVRTWLQSRRILQLTQFPFVLLVRVVLHGWCSVCSHVSVYMCMRANLKSVACTKCISINRCPSFGWFLSYCQQKFD